MRGIVVNEDSRRIKTIRYTCEKLSVAPSCVFVDHVEIVSAFVGGINYLGNGFSIMTTMKPEPLTVREHSSSQISHNDSVLNNRHNNLQY